MKKSIRTSRTGRLGNRPTRAGPSTSSFPSQAFNAALAACRRCRRPADALALWRRLCDAPRAAPDGISAAETVAALERANATRDADAVFADAVARGVALKRSVAGAVGGVGTAAFLDEPGEYDVSGLPVPLARCAVRKALADVGAAGGGEVVFITGVGAKRRVDRAHVPLRTHVLAQLRDECGLDAAIPPDAPGTVRAALAPP